MWNYCTRWFHYGLLAILLAIVSHRRGALPGEPGERWPPEREFAPVPVGSCGGLAAPASPPSPPSELIWRGDKSAVVEMDSTQRIKPRDLVVGGRYLHRNGLFIREIEAIEGNTVHYHDQASSWSCSNSVFVRTCPTLATPEDEARAAKGFRQPARGT